MLLTSTNQKLARREKQNSHNRSLANDATNATVRSGKPDQSAAFLKLYSFKEQVLHECHLV